MPVLPDIPGILSYGSKRAVYGQSLSPVILFLVRGGLQELAKYSNPQTREEIIPIDYNQETYTNVIQVFFWEDFNGIFKELETTASINIPQNSSTSLYGM